MAHWQLKQKKTPWVNKDSADSQMSRIDSSEKEQINWTQAVADYLPKQRKIEDPAPPESREKKLSILTASYPLNYSRTKQILIGLYYDATQKLFLPMAQLTNADYSYNIYMDNGTWSSVKSHFDVIAQFFEANSEKQPDKINVNGLVDIVFTSSCGAKAVLFLVPSFNITLKNMYKCSIIMHKKTFDGLRRVAACADERFRQVSSITTQTNNCKDYMREALSTLIDISSVHTNHRDILVYDVLIRKKASDVLNNIKKIFINDDDSVFLKHYFDLVYVELANIPQIFVKEIKDILSADK